MILKRLLTLLALFITCSGCVSQYKVVVDFSPVLRDHFVEFPTIEVDIAAVTDSELNEVKQLGVEKYFAPGSGIRQQLHSQTCFFYKEEQHTFVLPSRAAIWQTWKLKKPDAILVIASLPYDPSMSPQADPRYLSVKLKTSYVFTRTIYALVEPRRVIQVAKSSKKGGESYSQSQSAGGQWVEIR